MPSIKMKQQQLEDISDHTALQAESILNELHAGIRTLLTKHTGFQTFEPQPTDVFIVSWRKSGTTLMQQLVYQLFAATGRVPSDPDGERFADISEVVPFIEPREFTGISESINPYEPRVWKSHTSAETFKGRQFRKCSYIYCVRNGRNVASSNFDFKMNWIFSKPIEDKKVRKEVYNQYFIQTFLGMETMPDGTVQRIQNGKRLPNEFDWFKHVQGFMEAPLESILFLVYEDAIKDIKTTIRRIARFLSIAVTDEIVERVAAKCARETMAKDARFNDNIISKANGLGVNRGVRVRPKDAPGIKNIKLPDSSLELYDKRFQETFGVKEYSELVEILRKRNRV